MYILLIYFRNLQLQILKLSLQLDFRNISYTIFDFT